MKISIYLLSSNNEYKRRKKYKTILTLNVTSILAKPFNFSSNINNKCALLTISKLHGTKKREKNTPMVSDYP